MTILVIGSNGQVGWELERQGRQMGLPIKAKDLPEIDITDLQSVAKNCNADTRLIINAAAYTAVDKAESEAELAFAVNQIGPRNLACFCADQNIPLIHLSTDYVFDGSKHAPYTESDPIAPLGVYGESKSAGEVAVRSVLAKHLILRTSWLSGLHGQNFVKTMLRLGREREIIRVVNDQHGCPTFAFDLAEVIVKLAVRAAAGEDLPWGTYHYCGQGATTWYELTQKIILLAGKYIELKVHTIEPIPTAAYPTAAKRPRYSVLDCSLIQRHLGIVNKPWQEGLIKLIHGLLADQ